LPKRTAVRLGGESALAKTPFGFRGLNEKTGLGISGVLNQVSCGL